MGEAVLLLVRICRAPILEQFVDLETASVEAPTRHVTGWFLLGKGSRCSFMHVMPPSSGAALEQSCGLIAYEHISSLQRWCLNPWRPRNLVVQICSFNCTSWRLV